MDRFLIHAHVELGQSWTPARFSQWLGELVTKLGGRLQSVDFTLHEPNVVLLLELPEVASVMALSEAGTREGRLTLGGVTPLVRLEYAQASLEGGIGAPAPASDQVALVEPPAPAEPVAGRDFVDVSTAALPPGCYELAVGRFPHFADLTRFLAALHRLPGMRKIEVGECRQGTVSLRVHYDGVKPLETRLAGLTEFRPRICAVAPGRLDLELFGAGSFLHPTRVTEDVRGEPVPR